MILDEIRAKGPTFRHGCLECHKIFDSRPYKTFCSRQCDVKNRTRKLAYEKWVKAGCPTTSEEQRNQFWYEAEKEILQTFK